MELDLSKFTFTIKIDGLRSLLVIGKDKQQYIVQAAKQEIFDL